MNIQKCMILMGDRIRLHFFLDEDNTYKPDILVIWFADKSGKSILGDNYHYYIDKFNKKEIKAELKLYFPDEKGLYKELIALLTKMKDYESI